MKIEIIVPAINLWARYTKNAINSIMDAMIRAKAHGYDTHLLLIDNASTDETQAEASKMNADLFEYHRNEERWGFQKSVNFGVKYGFEHGAELVFVCNNDIVLHPEAIWRLADRFGKGDIGMATCMNMRAEMDRFHQLPSMIGSINANDKETIPEAPHPHFSAFMVSKECWQEIGEFDEAFAPAYWEDVDYHIRMKISGLLAIVYPPAIFYHYGSRTQNEAKEDGLPFVPGGMFDNNKAYIFKKWGTLEAEKINYIYPFNDPTKSIRWTQQNPV